MSSLNLLSLPDAIQGYCKDVGLYRSAGRISLLVVCSSPDCRILITFRRTLRRFDLVCTAENEHLRMPLFVRKLFLVWRYHVEVHVIVAAALPLVTRPAGVFACACRTNESGGDSALMNVVLSFGRYIRTRILLVLSCARRYCSGYPPLLYRPCIV